MKFGIYAVYDSKAETYMMPAALPNNPVALRGFTDAINNPNTDISKHPGDYGFFKIGEYDQETGEVIPTDKTCLANGMEVIQQNPDPGQINLV